MGELVYMTDASKKAFAKRLRAFRTIQFETAKELADLLGLEAQTYNKYEQGRAFPKYPILIRICRELGCSVEELLYGASKGKRADDPPDLNPIPLRRKR
jgi:transcriptional regulator with XRE-family HTH domain